MRFTLNTTVYQEYGGLSRRRKGSVLIQGLLVFFVFIAAANNIITQTILRKEAQLALQAARSVMTQHNEVIEKLRLLALQCDVATPACFTFTYATDTFIYTITYESDTLNVLELSIVNK